jgi:hypothetical protein
LLDGKSAIILHLYDISAAIAAKSAGGRPRLTAAIPARPFLILTAPQLHS